MSSRSDTISFYGNAGSAEMSPCVSLLLKINCFIKSQHDRSMNSDHVTLRKNSVLSSQVMWNWSGRRRQCNVRKLVSCQLFICV